MATKKISKAAVIRRRYAELGGGAEAVRIIAEEVGCSREYVRIAARQRLQNGMSPSDIRYRAKPEVVAVRKVQNNEHQKRYYRTSEKFREWKREYSARRYRERVAAKQESA